VRVATRGPLAGWTAVASDGADVRVAGEIDRARFERLFLSVPRETSENALKSRGFRNPCLKGESP